MNEFARSISKASQICDSYESCAQCMDENEWDKDDLTGRWFCPHTFVSGISINELNRMGDKIENRLNRGKKKLYSVYISCDVLDGLSELARYRSAFLGVKNGRGQSVGAGTLIDEAARMYFDAHKAELDNWREIFANIEPPKEK